MTLSQIIKLRTDNGRAIIDFLVDVMNDRCEDFRICHRLQAARLLITYGNEDAPYFIADNTPDSKPARAAPARPTAFDTELARIITEHTDDGRSIVRFLVNVMEGELHAFKPHHRISAARELLDRGFGSSAHAEPPAQFDHSENTQAPEPPKPPVTPHHPPLSPESPESADVLDTLTLLTPSRFERAVLDLLENMGYGRGRHVGRAGDGGIDGIIDRDALGLDSIYVQAKRWTRQVGSPEIRNFSGSLDPHGATTGILITTSDFSDTARRAAETISAGPKRIRLVNGQELAILMLRHNVRVAPDIPRRSRMQDENYHAHHTPELPVYPPPK